MPLPSSDDWTDVPAKPPLKAKVAADSGWEDVPAQSAAPAAASPAQKLPPVPSNFDREATEFGLGLASGASGLPETMHPLKDAVKGMGAAPPTDELVGESIFPGYGMAKNIYRSGKELFSPTGANEDPEDAAMRRAHGAGSLAGQVVPGMLGEASEEGGTLAAKVARTEGGAGPIRPALSKLARVGGAYGGYELAKYPGAVAGGYLGPTLVDAVTPRRTAPSLIESIKASSAPPEAINKEGSVASGGGEHPVTRIPIRETPFTNPLTPEQVPGKPQLREIAGRGDVRAGQELQRRGESVLYTPEEGYPPPRESTTFSSRGGETRPQPEAAPVPPEAGDSETGGPSAGGGGPSGPPKGVPERRASVRDIGTEDPMRTARMNQIRDQLKDPGLSLRDKTVLQSQLDDMKSNPFERTNPKEVDVKAAKAKNQPRMSLKEATAASEKRSAGRKARKLKDKVSSTPED